MTKRFRPHIIEISIAVATFIVVVVVALILVQRETDHPPIHYMPDESRPRELALAYEPNKRVYLPGETLFYTPTLITQKTGRVDVLRTFYDLTRLQSAKLCDGSDAPQDFFRRLLPHGIYHNLRGGRQVRINIPRMPPGDYIVQSSVVDPAAGGEAYVEVHFSITKPC